jgi:branched-chain amino acid transport system permease protein
METIAQLIVSGVMLGGVYAVMAIGLTLIFGVLKVVNFAHGEFLMLAMYLEVGLNQRSSLGRQCQLPPAADIGLFG